MDEMQQNGSVESERQELAFLKQEDEKLTQAQKAKKYFNGPYTKNGDTILQWYECQIDECNKEVNGTKLSNLVSHLKFKHTKYYKLVRGEKKESMLVKRLQTHKNTSSGLCTRHHHSCIIRCEKSFTYNGSTSTSKNSW